MLRLSSGSIFSEMPHARHRLHRGPVDRLRHNLRLYLCLQPAVTGQFAMNFEIIVGGVTFVGLLAYLLFALIHSERF
jgi:K+-transporting ATPase KdpF subunit